MNKKIKKILENKGFNITRELQMFELSMFTPAGEDWYICLNALEDIEDYANGFDPEEEFTKWINAKQQGFQGIPSVPELWKDQLWKQELLNKIVEEINQ